MPEWTKEQLNAIEHSDGGAIVSASAGSGKTAVLTERAVRLITSGEADPSRMVIVTFTDKAAAELRARLNRSLRELMIAQPENAKFLRAQTAKLQSAKISTISAFCLGLLREYAHLTDLSANFTLIEEVRAELLQKSVLDAVLEEFYCSAGQEDIDLVSEYFIGKSDYELERQITDIYKFCVNMPDYEDWLDGLMTDEYIKDLRVHIENMLKTSAQDALESYKLFREAASAEDKQRQYILDMDASVASALEFIISQPDAKRRELDGFLAGVPEKAAPTGNEQIKELRKAFVNQYTEVFSLVERLNDSEADTKRFLPVQQILARLAKEFDRRYREEKRAQNVVDFSDGEQGVYRLLKEHPEVAQQAAFSYIIVDEFQDSNEIQYEIFRRLSDNEKNLYFVGDLKQSIYNFRGAQPEVFSSVAKNDKYTLLPLNTNFRSNSSVIEGINAIFDYIMTERLGGADYKKDSRLVCGRDGEASDENITELVKVISDGDKSTDPDAEYIADRIKSMLDSGMLINGRPCRQEDFAVLMRSPRSRGTKYAEAFRARGLSVNTVNNEKFSERPEIELITDFLTVLDNPYKDRELARLLMSPVFGFDAEMMAGLRTGTLEVQDIDGLRESCGEELYRYSDEFTKKRLFSCITYAAEHGFRPDGEKYPALAAAAKNGDFGISDKPNDKCAEFLSEVYRLRSFMAGSSAEALIQKIYDSTQVKNLLMLYNDPSSCAANLRELIHIAKENSDRGGSLSDLIRYITDSDVSVSVGNEQNKGVKIMSIHGAKGLQFPICFVSDCSKMFNADDVKKNLIISKTFGLAGKITDKKNMIRRPSPSYRLAKKELTDRQLSEEMRLLYVAATRAEEKLIFVGSSRIYENSYMRWLLNAGQQSGAENMRSKNPCTELCFGGKVKYSCLYQPPKPEEQVITPKAPEVKQQDIPEDTAAIERIAGDLKYKYPYSALSKLPAKYTATELVQNRRITKGSTENCELYISRPDFIGKTGRLTGKQRGDAYHKAMQYLPTDRILSGNELTDELDKLSGVLTEKERECIDPADIEKFYLTPQAGRMIKSGNIYREQPIFHRLDVSGLTAGELGISEDERLLCQKLGADPYVQGIADLFFIEDGKIILIDYKSDSFSDDHKLIADYGFQLQLYAEALEQMYGMPVTEKYIFSFMLGRMIDIEEVVR